MQKRKRKNIGIGILSLFNLFYAHILFVAEGRDNFFCSGRTGQMQAFSGLSELYVAVNAASCLVVGRGETCDPQIKRSHDQAVTV